MLCMSSSDAQYLYEVSKSYLERFSNYSADGIFSHELLFHNVQRSIIQTAYKKELLFLGSARLIMLKICLKFYQDIVNGFKFIERSF